MGPLCSLPEAILHLQERLAPYSVCTACTRVLGNLLPRYQDSILRRHRLGNQSPLLLVMNFLKAENTEWRNLFRVVLASVMPFSTDDIRTTRTVLSVAITSRNRHTFCSALIVKPRNSSRRSSKAPSRSPFKNRRHILPYKRHSSAFCPIGESEDVSNLLTSLVRTGFGTQ